MAKIKIDIKPIEFRDDEIDASITAYHVVIEDKEKNAIWEETWGSEELLNAFLQGVKAAFSFTEVGHIEIPPIPRNSL